MLKYTCMPCNREIKEKDFKQIALATNAPKVAACPRCLEYRGNFLIEVVV